MMKKIATAAAALSLIVGASPAFAIFPDFPIEPDNYQNASTGSVPVYRQVEPTPSDDWAFDLGWEALGVLPPAARTDDTGTMEFDGLSFSEDLLEDDQIVVESEFDFAI